MVLALPDSWVWDFWLADDGERHHLFFLFASRALGDPERRHGRAGVGHAVSEDLVHWERVEDALVHVDPGAFDDAAVWTGSVVADPAGGWRMLYTGARRTPDGLAQSIGSATSPDLLTWTRDSAEPVLVPDHPAYDAMLGDAFRDPWVTRLPDGSWQLLVTARSVEGPQGERGVLARAVSDDLVAWTLLGPATEPGHGFPHLEVPQVEVVDGRAVLLFSCPADETRLPGRRSGSPSYVQGVWAAPADGLAGPYHLEAASPLVDDDRYSGRLVRRRDGRWCLMGFHRDAARAEFLTISDPQPVVWRDGRLVLSS